MDLEINKGRMSVDYLMTNVTKVVLRMKTERLSTKTT